MFLLILLSLFTNENNKKIHKNSKTTYAKVVKNNHSFEKKEVMESDTLDLNTDSLDKNEIRKTFSRGLIKSGLLIFFILVFLISALIYLRKRYRV